MAKRQQRAMAGATGKMVANCPYCKDWEGETRGRIVRCRFSDGVTHAAPEMWIAARADRLEREHGMGPMEAWGWAWMHWGFNCGTQGQVDGLITQSDGFPHVTPELIARKEAEVREGRLAL